MSYEKLALVAVFLGILISVQTISILNAKIKTILSFQIMVSE